MRKFSNFKGLFIGSQSFHDNSSRVTDIIQPHNPSSDTSTVEESRSQSRFSDNNIPLGNRRTLEDLHIDNSTCRTDRATGYTDYVEPHGGLSDNNHVSSDNSPLSVSHNNNSGFLSDSYANFANASAALPLQAQDSPAPQLSPKAHKYLRSVATHDAMVRDIISGSTPAK